MADTAKVFQKHADDFLAALKTHLFDGKGKANATDFIELFSMFVSSCEKVLVCSIKR
jgi:hypothetical protein